ncbi:hypothetical protein [Runella zeae]|uniref:hypothetical protein n=1 Tax=Runella zeae TaxID=94255 RepID=UPI002356CF7E|nr:hypothetical protein [Runella zeae]
MAKPPKRTPYTEEHIAGLGNSPVDQERKKELLEELLGLLFNGKGDQLSFYEKRFIYNQLSVMQDLDENKGILQKIREILKHKDLDDLRFMEVARDYWRDVDGYTINYKLKIDREETIRQEKLVQKTVPISQIEKYMDMEVLNKHYKEWQSALDNNSIRYSNKLLDRFIIETKQFRKNFIRNNNQYYGYLWIKKEEKKLIIRSKYFYLVGVEVFQNVDHFTIQIGPYHVEYNIDSYVHIAVRHFQDGIGNNDKSHFQQDFAMRKDVKILTKIFEKANGHNLFDNLPIDNLAGKLVGLLFEFNEQAYTIWIQKKKSGSHLSNEFYQIDTFYPTKNPEEIKLYKQLDKIEIGTITNIHSKEVPLAFYKGFIEYKRPNNILHKIT